MRQERVISDYKRPGGTYKLDPSERILAHVMAIQKCKNLSKEGPQNNTLIFLRQHRKTGHRMLRKKPATRRVRLKVQHIIGKVKPFKILVHRHRSKGRHHIYHDRRHRHS